MDERRYEDVPVDEIEEWITQRVNEQIADAFDLLADLLQREDRPAVFLPALSRAARRLRVPPEG